MLCSAMLLGNTMLKSDSIFREVHFIPKQSEAKGEPQKHPLQRKELCGAQGRTSRGLSVRGISNVVCRRKRHTTFRWSHAPRKACPGAQYNGRELQKNLLQRIAPALQKLIHPQPRLTNPFYQTFSLYFL